MNERYELRDKPSKCPKCSSERIVRILYGEPMASEELMADLKAGRIVLGGCCVTGDDTTWKCMECEMDIYRK